MRDAFMRCDSNAYNEKSNPEVSEICLMDAVMTAGCIHIKLIQGIVCVGVSHNGNVLDLIEERVSIPPS